MLVDEFLLKLKSVDITESGHYIMAGNDSFDLRLIELNPAGDILWDRAFNWSPFYVQCTAGSVQTTLDGGYAIFGSAWPSDGKDFYIVKTDKQGNL